MQLISKKFQRGVALVESTLMMSFILLMMYALVQTSMSSYYQISADGASFVGTHTAVANAGTSGPSPSVVAQVIQNVFQGVGKATVAIVHPSNTTTEADLTFNPPLSGGAFVRNAPPLTSREIETSADYNDTLTPGFPQAGSVECIGSAVNAMTGTVAPQVIADIPANALTTVQSTSPGAAAGSLSITKQTIAAAFGSTGPSATVGPLTINAGLSSAQTEIATDLSAINAGVSAVAQLPAPLNTAGTSIAMQITGEPVSPSVGVPIPGMVPTAR